MKESGDDDTYYLNGPSEFATPVEKERIEKEAEKFAGGTYKKNHFPVSWHKAYNGFIAGHESSQKVISALQEENARLRSLIQEAFEYGWFRSKDNLYSVIWEQFKKDNNL